MRVPRALPCLALGLALVGCGSSAATAATSESPRSPGSWPPSAPAACTPDAGLAEVRALLAGQTFEAHYLTIGQLLTISIWLIDPSVDPDASPSAVADGYRQALDTGLETAYAVSRLSCAGRAFGQVNPMIVDGRRQNWYIGFIPMTLLAELRDPTPAQLRTAVEDAGIAPARRRRFAPLAPSPGAALPSCTWDQVRPKLQSELDSGKPNVAAYEIIGAGLPNLDPWNAGPLADVDVEAQWVVTGAPETADSIVLERLGRLTLDLACLSPAVDTFEVFIVNGTGALEAYARVPGSLVRAGRVPLPASAVMIERFGGASEAPSSPS